MQSIEGEGIFHGQTYGKWNNTAAQEKIQERKSSAASTSQLKVFKVSTLSFDADICGNKLLGHCFLPLLLIEAAYCDCLRKVFLELLQDVDLQPRILFCFMFCDAAPHFDL
jgi:hypothetical protein